MAAELWGQGHAATFLLSQARHALSLIIAVLHARGIAAPRIFVPGYYCESALAPARQLRAELVFFAVQPDMTPDWSSVEDRARQGAPHLFILAHYFGTESTATAEAVAFARRHGALLFEDAAHVLLPVGGIGRTGDFVGYSPRKFLEVPDGAVLSVRDADLAGEAARAAAALESPRRAMLGPRFAQWRDHYLPWRVRNGPLPATDFDLDPDPGGTLGDLWMSDHTRLRIDRMGRQGLAAVVARELGAVTTMERSIATATPLVPLARLPDAVPYFLGFRAKDRAMAEEMLGLLRRVGANAGTWPDMPPEVRADTKRHGAALELRNTVLRVYPRFFNRRRPLDFLGKLPERAG